MELDCAVKNSISTYCTWNLDSGCQDLKATIKFSDKPSYGLEDIVQVETCVHMCWCGPNFVPCKITVELDKKFPYVITRFDTISEARIIECYGRCEEYLSTVHGEHMDDFEGCTVYSSSSELPPSQEVTLKFARMKHNNKMWLYGLLFTIEQVSAPQLKVAGINLSNVNDKLKGTSRPLSDKAEHCKKLLQQCGNSIDNCGSIDPQVLLKMFEGEYLKPLGESSKSLSKCLMRLIPFIMSKTEGETVGASDTDVDKDVERIVIPTNSTDAIKSSVIPSSSICNNNNIHVNNCNMEDYIKTMKDYVDKRINDMEEMLTNKLEQRLRDIELAQNSKLDAIMKLLEKK